MLRSRFILSSFAFAALALAACGGTTDTTGEGGSGGGTGGSGGTGGGTPAGDPKKPPTAGPERPGDGPGVPLAIRQLSLAATSRLTFNTFAGIHDDRDRDLNRGQNGRNRNGGANVMYRMAPNVVLTFEGIQIRSNYVGTVNRRMNRYDLSIAYLF